MSLTPGPESWERSPQLRAGDAERQLVLDELAEAFATGRLAQDEYDERSSAALRARSLGDLTPLLEDLVRTGSPGTALVPLDIEQRAVQKFERERREAIWGFISTSGICWVIWTLVMFGGFPWPAIVTAVTGLNALRVLYQRDDIISAERRRLERRARKQIKPPDPPDS